MGGYSIIKLSQQKMKVIRLVFWFIWMYVVSVTIHEYAHLTSLVLLGGRGYIYMNTCIIQEAPPPPLSRVPCYIGGIGCALFFLAAWFFTKDLENRIIIAAMCVRQFIYGIGEGLGFQTKISAYYYAGDYISALAMVLTTIFLIIRQKEDNKIGQRR